ncbi:MAG: type I-U CRISPR-associated protein Cas5/Cas6 [Alphaproteobacteria bacterium]|nr:type I-U CRISPR-associated protein Cas5/Cas6 [Alphaproteobacteria bacterium]
MICLRLKFPAGRYNATPWGRHVNEGDVAWPPEPYRVLRALIAVWHRKADKSKYTYERLAELIDALSEADPRFRLPESVHAHSRHYMPQGKLSGGGEQKRLVIDAFLRIAPDDPLIIGWDVALDENTRETLEHLIPLLSYFGRAESIVAAEALRDWPSKYEPNSVPRPIEAERLIADGPQRAQPVDLLAPIKASKWPARRHELLSLNRDKPKSKSPQVFEKTIPERLVDALSVDTGVIQAAKWSGPPAGRLVLYDRRPLSPTPSTSARRRAGAKNSMTPTVARFILAGKPRPSIFDTVMIAETMRRAAMSKWGWSTQANGRKQPNAPSLISGRDDNDEPLRNAKHSHAFWLPEDADCDGFIDHVTVFAREGFDADCQRNLSRLARLWVEHGAPDEDGERGRKEWRLALEGFGEPADFAADSALLKHTAKWRSATPYLRPRFGPRTSREVELQICRELAARGLPAPQSVIVGSLDRPAIIVSEDRPCGELAVKFRRTRSRRDLAQPDTLGCSVEITFSERIDGPLALGFASHFGLGLFKAVDPA